MTKMTKVKLRGLKWQQVKFRKWVLHFIQKVKKKIKYYRRKNNENKLGSKQESKHDKQTREQTIANPHHKNLVFFFKKKRVKRGEILVKKKEKFQRKEKVKLKIFIYLIFRDFCNCFKFFFFFGYLITWSICHDLNGRTSPCQVEVSLNI